MRVKCANCGLIWDYISYGAWYVGMGQPAQPQTVCPNCASNAYDRIEEAEPCQKSEQCQRSGG